MPSKTTINQDKYKGFTKAFKKTLLRQSLNYLSIFSIVAGSTLVSTEKANANAINFVENATVTAADNGDGNTAVTTADVFTVGNGNMTINTAAAAMTFASIISNPSATIVTMAGTGGLRITGALTATSALTVIVNDSAQNVLSIGAVSGAVVKLETNSIVTLTGAVTHGGTFTLTDDGDGTINVNGATTFNGAIGADADDLGTLNINAATTIGIASFAKDVNIDANTIFTGDMNANTVDILEGATTTVVISDKFLKASGNTSVMTMNLTGQIIKLNTADIVSGDLTAATDGFGEVQVDVNNTNMTGNIGTSTTVKVGLLDMDKDLNTAGNIFVDATTIDDAEVLTVSGQDKTVTGTINGDGAVEGLIVVNSGAGATKVATFTGDLGTTAELKQLTLTTEATFEGTVKVDNIDIAAATTGIFKGDVTIGAADLTLGDATASATFSGTTTQTIIGGAGGEDILGTGIVQISNTSNEGVNFGAHAHLGTNTLQLKLAADAVLTNSVTGHILKDVTTLGGSSIVLDDTIVASDIVFTATETLDEDSIHASSFIKMPANFDNGEALVLFAEVKNADVAAITADVNSALVDTGLVDYVATTTSTDDITVTATETTDAQAATTLSVTVNDAKALRQARTAFTTSAAGLDEFSDILSLSNGKTATNRKKFVKEAAPQTEMIAGSTVASQGVTNSVQGIISNRMASLRSGDAYAATGMSAGGAMSAKSGFIQAFGSEAEQKDRSSGGGTLSGFDSDSAGVAIGFDGITDAGTTVGLSVSMSSTDVDSKGLGKAKNDIDTYTASVYMDKATDSGYVEGSLTVGVSENKTSRNVTATDTDRVLSGAYDSQQISLNVGVGMPNDIGTGYVTPFVSFTGTQIDTDSYLEKSTVANDTLRLTVSQDDVTSLVGSLGVKYHNVMDNGGTPMISFSINNEFGDNSIGSSNTYQGGGTAFKTSTEVEELSATLGVGYSLGNDYTSIEFNYEADANDDKYLSHGGSIKIVGKF
jgi:uncharacterized protein with beta-barrel porin domain